MITLKNISKSYQLNNQTFLALDNVNLHIPEQSIFGIIGPSGAGKSTLVNIMNLLEKPSQGEVLIDGQSLNTLSPTHLRQSRRKIGMVFQQFNLLSSRTVYDNIALPLELIGQSPREINERVLPLLDLVNLTDRANHKPDQLSGGQKQRTAIARALASNPTVLLCDEATSALDPESTENILELLQTINKTYQLTIVMISHEIAVIKQLCDHVAILESGQIIESGPVLEIFTTPKQKLTKRFIQTVMNIQLPPQLTQCLQNKPGNNTNPLLQLTFIGDAIENPLLAKLTEQFDIETSIVQANIDWIQNTVVGITIFELLGKPEACQQAIDYLTTQPIQFEIIGYVNSTL